MAGQVDVSGLKLKKIDQTNWEEYPAGGGGPMLPPHDPGKYYLKVPPVKDMTFEAKDGYLVVLMDLTVENPVAGKDPQVRFERITTKPYAKGKRKGACRAGDFLRSCGSEATPGANQEEWAEAIAECAEQIAEARLNWDCYDSEGEKSLADSYDDFPDNPNGEGKLPYITVGEGDKAKRFRARQKVQSYVHGQKAESAA